MVGSLSERDVIVIGAGAAGLACGRRLGEAGLDVVIVEARDRIGGRAHTIVPPGLGHPIDRGCGWLHSGDRNPFTAIAETLGFTVDRRTAAWDREDGEATDEAEAFGEAWEAFFGRVEAAAKAGRDGPAADHLTPGGRFNAQLDAISTYSNGVPLSELSVVDYGRYADSGVNWRVREGYGALIAAHGAGVPIELDCAVLAVDHGGARVRVETAKGALLASAVVVTVPTSLLAAEAIRFTPALPDKTEAASAVPLGLADKLVLALDRPDMVLAESHVMGRRDRRDTGSYYLRPYGLPMIEGYFGGPFAAELERGGEAAFAAVAIEELATHFGPEIRRHLRPVSATAWGLDPHARGSYSAARPGFADRRAVLARPVDGRLFFAGEATHPTDFSTAHGAHRSGLRAAGEVLAALGR